MPLCVLFLLTFSLGAQPHADVLSTGLYVDPATAQKALEAAITEWEIALQHNIKRPSLVEWFGGGETATAVCAGNVPATTIACIDAKKYQIDLIAFNLTTEDLKTVLMHEIGHILHVPHIEGDDLMNARYVKKVDRPTPAAIAIALTKSQELSNFALQR
jgi:hypothetical protein